MNYTPFNVVKDDPASVFILKHKFCNLYCFTKGVDGEIEIVMKENCVEMFRDSCLGTLIKIPSFFQCDDAPADAQAHACTRGSVARAVPANYVALLRATRHRCPAFLYSLPIP